MKRFLPALASLILCHCSLGTEVGNGVRTTSTDGDGKASGTAGNPSPDGAPTTDEAAALLISNYFITACASPFAENIHGGFSRSTSGQPIIKIFIQTNGTRTVLRFDDVLVWNVKPLPDLSPYSIESQLGSPSVTCGPVSSQTLADGTVERTLTLSDGAVLSWILDAGSVVSMAAGKPNALEYWYKVAD